MDHAVSPSAGLVPQGSGDRTGRVFLVGAGPGDPGLLTCRGREVLGQADVVVFDRLVDGSLLRLAPAEAERVYAGKEPGQATRTQAEINRTLIERAGRGLTVVRLKGGDPFVFGRGGEEALALAATGIPFEVVPGVTSAVAVPAYAGIPVTHRGVARSFVVVTGQQREDGSESTVDWQRLAGAADTLVVLMGVGELPGITGELIAGGRAPTTPAAIIQGGTTGGQRVVEGPLQRIAELARSAGVRSPATLVVGEVCRLRSEMSWFESRPLFGRRVVITRTREQGSEVSTLLRLLGAEVIELPVLRIVPRAEGIPVDNAVRYLHGYGWVVFTSANAVSAFFSAVRRLGRDGRALHGCRLACVGPATARALGEYGLLADVVPERATATDLVEAMRDKVRSGERVLFPCGQPVSDDLQSGLESLQLIVERITVYEATPDPEAAGRAAELAADSVDAITFASSATVGHFLAAAGEAGSELCAASRVVCIGPVTAKAAEALGLRVDAVASTASAAGLADAILRAVKWGGGSSG